MKGRSNGVLPFIPNDALAYHQASYEVYMDELDNYGKNLHVGGQVNCRAKVGEATKRQLAYAGQDRPVYKKRRNSNLT